MNDAEKMTEIVAKFVALVGKKLPDDIMAKLRELRAAETTPIANTLYDSMFHNMEQALELNRPMCQDTGVIQYFVKVGTKFPLIDELEGILRQATVDATIAAPLRHNAVETFDEFNTKKNVGTSVPLVDIALVPGSDQIEIEPYMAGGGCTLPGAAKVLMPSEGYEGLLKFVFDVMTERGLNACPPLLVGIGVATSVETAAMLSKKALLRPIGTRSENARAAELEAVLEKEFNVLGLGPQGLTGSSSVMGVHIEHAARHPSTIGVAISTGCWAHRRGHIVLRADLSYEIISHKGAIL